jgi:hypothetical protein
MRIGKLVLHGHLINLLIVDDVPQVRRFAPGRYSAERI